MNAANLIVCDSSNMLESQYLDKNVAFFIATLNLPVSWFDHRSNMTDSVVQTNAVSPDLGEDENNKEHCKLMVLIILIETVWFTCLVIMRHPTLGEACILSLNILFSNCIVKNQQLNIITVYVLVILILVLWHMHDVIQQLGECCSIIVISHDILTRPDGRLQQSHQKLSCYNIKQHE